MIVRRKSGLHHVVAISAAALALSACVVVYRFCHQMDLMAAQFRLETGPQATLLYDRNGQDVFRSTKKNAPTGLLTSSRRRSFRLFLRPRTDIFDRMWVSTWSAWLAPPSTT
jgi:hypothetical protein